MPDDSESLAAEFAAADEDTLYMRFFTPTFALTEERLHYLTEIDYRSHVALAVMTESGDNSQGAAIARYVARSDTEVEVAVVVKAEYRSRGIARILILRLALIAGAAGYRTMLATHLDENEAAGRLLESCGFVVVSDEDGVVELRRPLPPDSPVAHSV